MDLDEGVGAFASINAMQGYRPNPVAQYAIQLMRAQRGGKELPVAPEILAATYIENVADFAGAYHSVDGRVLNFLAEGGHSLLHPQRPKDPTGSIWRRCFRRAGCRLFKILFGIRPRRCERSQVRSGGSRLGQRLVF